MRELSLPAGITVFERGWLSANNILCIGPQQTALVDSGYCTHSDQTLALVGQALGGRPLDVLANTHLHSDHCGGNAILQATYPQLETRIPPGQAKAVRNWDPVALTYTPTGQQCPPFQITGLLVPGQDIWLGEHAWQVHAAPGHDTHSVVLFEPRSRTLISADALWEHGFGVVFAELEGLRAFDEVAATLDVIEDLSPQLVIPGHGRMFADAPGALRKARQRLEGFVSSPTKHATHAGKVLLKFKLLELQAISTSELFAWSQATPYFQLVHRRWFGTTDFADWHDSLLSDLVRSGAARLEGDLVING